MMQGVVSEFKIPKAENPNMERYDFHWLYTNGLLGIIFTFGVSYSSLKSRKARSWLYATGTFSINHFQNNYIYTSPIINTYSKME